MNLDFKQFKDGRRIVIKGALRLYEDLNTPVSLSCYLLLKNGEYRQLVEKSVDPSWYNTAWDYHLDNQAVAFLQKYPDLETGIDRDGAALEKFLEAEVQCSQTNDLLSQRLRLNSDVSSVFYIAQRKIASWLGKVKLSLDDWRFGPGVSSSCRGNFSHVCDKLQAQQETTREAAWLYSWFLTMPSYRAASSTPDVVAFGSDELQSTLEPRKIQIVNGNSLTFVPKNAKVSRSICIEPDLNIQGQLIVGAAIRRALRYAGLDLNEKAPHLNKVLARRGSKFGNYATIDLSSASDTLSIALVYELLPLNWAQLLSTLRSPYTKLPNGEWHENEKFSSMGNGFTFELESMIFYALALATKEYLGLAGRITVFGDDIIAPTGCVTTLLKVLAYAGFTANHRKTFADGPFRESCGTDWFAGINVRAYYLKETPKNAYDIYKILNGLRHVSARMAGSRRANPLAVGRHKFCLPIIRRTWWEFLSHIPNDQRLYGPASLGDQVIYTSRREWIEKSGWMYGLIEVRYAVPVMEERPSHGYRSDILLGAVLLRASFPIAMKGRVASYKIKRCSISVWHWDEAAWEY